MSVPLLLADNLAKGCNAACGRAIASLARLIVQLLWSRLHYWTLAIVGPLGLAITWARSRW